MCDPDPVPCSSPSSFRQHGLPEPSSNDRKYTLDPEDATRLQSSQCHSRLNEFLNSQTPEDQKEIKSGLPKEIPEEQDFAFVEQDVIASCSALDDLSGPRDLTRSRHASDDLCLTSTARGDLTGPRTVHVEHDNVVYAVEVPPYTEQMGVKLHGTNLEPLGTNLAPLVKNPWAESLKDLKFPFRVVVKNRRFFFDKKKWRGGLLSPHHPSSWIRHRMPVFDVRCSMFCGAELMAVLAGSTPEDVLKLRTSDGRYVAPWLFHLVPRTSDQTPVQLAYAIKHVCQKSPRALREDLELLERRLAGMAEQLTSGDCETVTQVRSRVVDLLGQLDRPDLSEWLSECTIVEQSCASTLEQCKPPIRSPYRRKTPQEISQVASKSHLIWEAEISAEVVQQLRLPGFDSWQWTPEEMLLLLQHMFINLNLTTAFHIDIAKLRRFLLRVYQNYNVVPFHNFRHGFCVAQMMFVMIWSCGLMERIDRIEVLTLMLACICHDLDHPGFNNIYQINAGTELALRYNDVSPLENHHCSVACTILQEVECDLLTSLSASDRRQVREGLIRCILATDMARHNEILAQFNELLPNFSYQIPAHVNMLSMVLIKIADVSNEARPLPIADHWIDRLLQEFYNQSDRERVEGLPVTPFMDRSKVNKAVSQCNFISLVLIPLLTPAVKLLEELQGLLLVPVRQALRHYTRQAELSQTPGADPGASPCTSAALTRQMSTAEDLSEAQVSQRSARFRIATGNGSSHGDSFDAMEGSDSSSVMVQIASPGERGEAVGGDRQSKDVLSEIQATPKDHRRHPRTSPIAEDDQPLWSDDQQRPQFDKKPEEVYGGGGGNPSMSTTPGRLSRYLRRISGRAAEKVSDTYSTSAPSSPRRGGNSSSRSLQSLVSFLTPEQMRSRSARASRFNLNLGRRRPPEEAITAEATVSQKSVFRAQEVSNLDNGSMDEFSRKEEDSAISTTSSPVMASTSLIVSPADNISSEAPTNGKTADCTGGSRRKI